MNFKPFEKGEALQNHFISLGVDSGGSIERAPFLSHRVNERFDFSLALINEFTVTAGY